MAETLETEVEKEVIIKKNNVEYIDPLTMGKAINEEGRVVEIYDSDCHCPCPKISAPVWGGAYVCFSPI